MGGDSDSEDERLEALLNESAFISDLKSGSLRPIQGTRAESAAVKQEPDLPTTLADFLTQAKEEGKRGEMERESRVVVEEESMDRFEVLRPRIIWSLQTFRDIFLLIYSEAR